MTQGPVCRVPLRESGDGDTQLSATYERVRASMKVVPRMYQALANAPELLDGWLDFAWTLRESAVSDRGIRELAILRVAQLTDSDYVWRSHVKLALDGGITQAQVDALSDWQTSEVYDETHIAVLAMTDQLTLDADVTDSVWSRFSAVFSDRQQVEIVLTVAWYTCAARTGKALRVPLEPWHDRVPGLAPSG
jgi:4-carboxymuconolactone decarboxylase